MTPLRVLSICHEDPRWILGGMGRHCAELFRAMSRRDDVEVDFVTCGPGEGVETFNGFRKWQADKLVCYKPRAAGFASYLLADLQIAKRLMAMVADGHRWDVVHEHEWTSVQLGRMVRDALNVPLIGTMHLCITKLAMVEDPQCMQTIGDWPEIEFYLRAQEGNLISDPDEFILCSQAYVDIIRETFLTRRPINMIYNGVDLDTWHPHAGDAARAVSECELSRSRPIALFVGRIATMKGIVPLLDAIESTDTGWQVVIAGEVNANSEAEREGWEVTRRLRALEKSSPERLRWVGFKSGQQLHDLFGAADCALMPSIHEPFGIVCLECFASGVPLIATQADGLGELVRDEGGREYARLIRPGSAHSIVQALADMRHEATRQRFRLLGLKRAKAFNWDVIADQTVKVYRQALKRRQLRKVS